MLWRSAPHSRHLLTAALIATGLGQSACGEPLELPYVEARSAEDVWDYTSVDIELKVRLVEYEDGITNPDGGALVFETLEVLATEGAIVRADGQVGVAVGDRVLIPVGPLPGTEWRSVDYAPGEIPAGAPIRYGFFGGGPVPQLYQATQVDTGLVYDRAKLLRYKR